MSATVAMSLAIVLPLIGVALVSLLRRSPNLREAASLTIAAATFLIVLFLLPKVFAGERPAFVLFTLVPGMKVAFALEPLGMLFALVASGLWILTTAYAIGYMRGHHEINQTRFFMCFALAISAALGIAFSGNMFTLFIFYEVLTLSTYPLVTHHGNEEAKRSGRVYLGILLSTSMGFLMLGMVWMWSLTGTLDFTPGGVLAGKATRSQVIALLVLFAFGTGKAALMPFHRWLPAAMVAPTPVSALLHAVAVVKAGVFTVMKVCVYLFGVGLLHRTGASEWLMYVAGGTLLLASLIALTKDNLKERLAYSTISQLSYIVLAAALANQAGVIGGGMHIAMHAFGKITLFFCAGAIYVGAHKKDISEMDGIGRRMPFTMTAFFVGSLCVIGLPPTGGSWSKWFLIVATQESGQMVFSIVLMLSSLLSVAYLMPVVGRAFFAPPSAAEQAGETIKIKEAPLFCVVPLCLTALGCVLLFFYSEGLQQLLLQIFKT